jgi:DinB superfamily/Pentapeptide repeats (8 copies)
MSDRRLNADNRVDDLDLSGVHVHGANFEGTRFTDVNLYGAEISGDIEGLHINGVDVDALVQAELDRRFPERKKLRSADIDALRDAWSMLEGLWAETVTRASLLPPDLQMRRVDGEWSFVETLRHLIFAADCWLFRAVRLVSHPYHQWGLPWTGADRQWAQGLGLELAATPDLAQVLPVRQEHQQAMRTTLENLTDGELTEVRTAPTEAGYPEGPYAVLHCLHVVLNEEWHHHLYAVRDLDALGA